MQILAGYLRKETFRAFLAILIVLLIFSIGQLFAESLRAVARGALPTSMLYIELGLRTIDSLTILLPLSLYLAVLAKLGQMYRNQELVMYHASGVSTSHILRMYLPQIVFFFIFLLIISTVILPLASQTSERLTRAASKDISLMGLKEGVFQELSGSNSVIYVSKINTEEKRLENIFVNVTHDDRVDTLTAEYGYQYEDEENGERYISLFNGFRNEGVPGKKKYNLMRFERNDIKLPKLEGKSVNVDEKGKSTFELFKSADLTDNAEFHKRLSSAIAAVVLLMLAVSISKTSPRDAKYTSLVLGLLIYICYSYLLAISFSMIAQGKIPGWIGGWWVHIIFIMYGLRRINKVDELK